MNTAPGDPPTVAPASSSQVIARMDGKPITADQITKPLIEGYGLNMLLNVVQLEYAKQQVAKQGLTVTPEDYKKERQETLGRLFKDANKEDMEGLLTQFLSQQHISKVDFDMVLEINTHLRKIAEPIIRKTITDEVLLEAFRQLYGETVVVRHIQLSRPEQIPVAKGRLAKGEPFDKVAQEMSTNARTAAMGGELPPFSRQSISFPQIFRDTAFALKEGEVSDAVEVEGAYHLIKLERRHEPKVVQFESVKESLREDVTERLLEDGVKVLRAENAAQVMKMFSIDDPVLKRQYDDRLNQREKQITETDEIKARFDRERQNILERAATQPSTLPASGVARPPATR